VFLGNGTRQCQRCGARFSDGSKEWDEMRLSEKFFLLFPNEVMLLLGLGLVLGLICYLMDDDGGIMDNITGASVVAAFAVSLLPFWVVRWFQVRSSRRRYESSQ
jgi:hypothetical protein